jgi:hypothetical protein
VDDFPLVGGRTCDVDAVLEGLTLTHRLDEEDRGHDRLLVGTDLDAFSLAEIEVPGGVEVPIAGAEPARYDHGLEWSTLVLPAGVVPDAPAVAVRWTADGLAFEALAEEEVPAPDPQVAERLLDTLRILRRHEDGIDPAQLVLEARVRYPLLFAEPQAPLTDLLASVGIVEHPTYGLFLPGEEVPDPDRSIADDAGEDLYEHLLEDHRLDERLAGAVLQVRVAVLRAVNWTLREMLRGAQERPEGTDLEEVVEDGRDGPLVRAAVLGDDLLPGDTAEVGDPADDDDEQAATVGALVAALEDDEAAAALVEDVLEEEETSAGAVLAFLDLAAPDLRHRRAKGNAAWLRARALELLADDHAEAERELRRAHDLGAHASATFDLARYLSDRGQAGAALGLLRQLTGPDIADRQELLEPYAEAGPTAAGRNDPCPCGSGRKHKVCCQARNGWPLQARLDWVWDKVVTFATRPPARELVETVARSLQAIGVDTRQPLVICLALFEGGLLEDLCDLRGSLLPADELELLRAWSRDTSLGLYEVVDVAGDDEVTLLDLLGGERYTFDDRAIARGAELGAAGLGWLVAEPDGTQRPLLGMSAVPDGWREPLLELLADDPELGEVLALLHEVARPPRLATSDGDRLRFVTRVLEVDDPGAVWEALSGRLDAREDGRLHLTEDRDGTAWLRGTIGRDDGRLVVTAMSLERADHLTGLVREVASEVRIVDEERQDPADLLGLGDDQLLDEQERAEAELAELGDEGGGDLRGSGLLDLESLPPEQRAAAEEVLTTFMRQAEDRWIDTPIPALGGATPRDAVDDPTRRDQLRRLLDTFPDASQAVAGPGRGMDADRLRALLGLER